MNEVQGLKAYYNEIEPFAAKWLRNLIAAGHLPRGDVDERSIEDVKPEDLKGYGQCHFFAGIGGWPLALSLAGWPDDQPVWTGSCPCQPFSGAGKRQGEADSRHLWPAFFRLISECRPATVFGEQVASALGREWFAAVRLDLEDLGYACGCADLCAAGVGAPHIRQRLFWVADAGRGSVRSGSRFRDASQESGETEIQEDQRQRRGPPVGDRGSNVWLADTESAGGRSDAGTIRGGQIERVRSAKGEIAGWSEREAGRTGDSSSNGWLADTHGAGQGKITRNHEEMCRHTEKKSEPEYGSSLLGRGSANGGLDDAAEPRRAGPVEPREAEEARDEARLPQPERRGGPRGLDLASPERRQPDSENIREHGAGDQPSGQGGVSSDRRLSSPWSDAELIPCADWKARPAPSPESGVFPLAHGIPNRVGKLRAYGNAIVPQVAAAFIHGFLRETSG